MNHVKQIVTAALTLTLICAVVVAALAGTNLMTKDVIAAQERDAAAAACRAVINADDFIEKTFTNAQGDAVAYYEAMSGDTLVGYVFSVTTNGKSSGLVTMTGVSDVGVVTGVQVVSDNETAGYIDKVIKGGLLDRLFGQTAESGVSSVDGVSQATKSSNGVKNGVSQALSYFAEVSGNE